MDGFFYRHTRIAVGKKRWTGLVVPVILKGNVAFLEYRPDEEEGVVLSAIFRDRFEFRLLLSSQRATKLGHQDGKIPRTANSSHSIPLSQGQAWSRHYFTKLARKTSLYKYIEKGAIHPGISKLRTTGYAHSPVNREDCSFSQRAKSRREGKLKEQQ